MTDECDRMLLFWRFLLLCGGKGDGLKFHDLFFLVDTRLKLMFTPFFFLKDLLKYEMGVVTLYTQTNTLTQTLESPKKIKNLRMVARKTC